MLYIFVIWQVFDLHRHNIDHITIPSSRGPEFGVLRRVEDVSYWIWVFNGMSYPHPTPPPLLFFCMTPVCVLK